LTASQFICVGGKAAADAAMAASTLGDAEMGKSRFRVTSGVSAALLSGSDMSRFSRSGSPDTWRAAPVPTTMTLPPPLLEPNFMNQSPVLESKLFFRTFC
jgi:hypothetical protein